MFSTVVIEADSFFKLILLVMVSFTALTKFMDNQKTHLVEQEFFEIFLLHIFRLIGPQTKQGNM
jgi:hypothetical protein